MATCFVLWDNVSEIPFILKEAGKLNEVQRQMFIIARNQVQKVLVMLVLWNRPYDVSLLGLDVTYIYYILVLISDFLVGAEQFK